MRTWLGDQDTCTGRSGYQVLHRRGVCPPARHRSGVLGIQRELWVGLPKNTYTEPFLAGACPSSAATARRTGPIEGPPRSSTEFCKPSVWTTPSRSIRRPASAGPANVPITTKISRGSRHSSRALSSTVRCVAPSCRTGPHAAVAPSLLRARNLQHEDRALVCSREEAFVGRPHRHEAWPEPLDLFGERFPGHSRLRSTADSDGYLAVRSDVEGPRVRTLRRRSDVADDEVVMIPHEEEGSSAAFRIDGRSL